MKFLLVTHDYPPITSARSIRWRAIAEHWAQQGHLVHVISAWQAGFRREELLGGVHVHRVNALWLEKLRARFKRAPKPSDEHQSTLVSGSGSTGPAQLGTAITRIAYWCYHNLYKKLYWPDAAHPWRKPAVQKARSLFRTEIFDAVITVSPYFSAHRVGLKLRRRGLQKPWLVDIGDPFSFLDSDPPNNRRLYRGRNLREEKRVFQQADAISVTTPETRARYAELFPEEASKIHVIPPLLALPSVVMDPAPFFPHDNVLRWVYLGRLYADIRRPDDLLKLFVETQRRLPEKPMELHFFGDAREVQDAFEPYHELLHNRIFVHEPVDRSTVQRILRDAGLLVNLGNKTAYQLPSKVVEYASACKPILNIAQIENDSSATFFEKHPVALTLYIRKETDVSEHGDSTSRFVHRLPPSIDEQSIQVWLSTYMPPSICNAYQDLILRSQQKVEERK